MHIVHICTYMYMHIVHILYYIAHTMRNESSIHTGFVTHSMSRKCHETCPSSLSRCVGRHGYSSKRCYQLTTLFFVVLQCKWAKLANWPTLYACVVKPHSNTPSCHRHSINCIISRLVGYENVWREFTLNPSFRNKNSYWNVKAISGGNSSCWCISL